MKNKKIYIWWSGVGLALGLFWAPALPAAAVQESDVITQLNDVTIQLNALFAKLDLPAHSALQQQNFYKCYNYSSGCDPQAYGSVTNNSALTPLEKNLGSKKIGLSCALKCQSFLGAGASVSDSALHPIPGSVSDYNRKKTPAPSASPAETAAKCKNYPHTIPTPDGGCKCEPDRYLDQAVGKCVLSDPDGRAAEELVAAIKERLANHNGIKNYLGNDLNSPVSLARSASRIGTYGDMPNGQLVRMENKLNGGLNVFKAALYDVLPKLQAAEDFLARKDYHSALTEAKDAEAALNAANDSLDKSTCTGLAVVSVKKFSEHVVTGSIDFPLKSCKCGDYTVVIVKDTVSSRFFFGSESPQEIGTDSACRLVPEGEVNVSGGLSYILNNNFTSTLKGLRGLWSSQDWIYGELRHK